MRQRAVRWLMVALLLSGLAAGCGSREPARSTEPDASKRELDKLNSARKKEWGN